MKKPEMTRVVDRNETAGRGPGRVRSQRAAGGAGAPRAIAANETGLLCVYDANEQEASRAIAAKETGLLCVYNANKQEASRARFAKNTGETCAVVENESGAFYVDALIGMMIFIALIFSFLTIPEILIKKQEIDYIARTVVRRIERDGMAGAALRRTLEDLKSETGIAANVEWTGAFFGADSKIQIRERFTVSATYTVNVKLIEPSFTAPVYIGVPIRKTLTGVSEVYWKD